MTTEVPMQRNPASSSPWKGLGQRADWKPLNAPREFTPAERSMIKRVHSYMPPRALLDVLNDRLVSDLGEGVDLFDMQDLKAAIAELDPPKPQGELDWPTIRKLLAKASRDGVLDQISEQTILDFAVVFSLTPKQVIVLKDIVLTPSITK